MSPSPREDIRPMMDEIASVLSQAPMTNFESFRRDATLKRAFVRSLEIIGEAAGKIPAPTAAPPRAVNDRGVVSALLDSRSGWSVVS